MKFNSMFGPGVEKTGLDYSNTKEPIYTEIPPYTKDENGEWLNETAFPMLVQTGVIDVQEKIQSYSEEVDIYRILERFAYSGDISLINRRAGVYTDVSHIPDNLHDFNSYVGDNLEVLKNIDPDLAKAILNENSTDADIENAYKAAIDKAAVNNVEKKEVEK